MRIVLITAAAILVMAAGAFANVSKIESTIKKQDGTVIHAREEVSVSGNKTLTKKKEKILSPDGHIVNCISVSKTVNYNNKPMKDSVTKCSNGTGGTSLWKGVSK